MCGLVKLWEVGLQHSKFRGSQLSWKGQQYMVKLWHLVWWVRYEPQLRHVSWWWWLGFLLPMEGGLVPHTDIEQQRHYEEHPAQRATFKECMQSTLMARLLVHLSPLHVKELHSLSLMAVHTRFLCRVPTWGLGPTICALWHMDPYALKVALACPNPYPRQARAIGWHMGVMGLWPCQWGGHKNNLTLPTKSNPRCPDLRGQGYNTFVLYRAHMYYAVLS